MQETVSVIIPYFNREHYLRKCIDSVLRQTYPYLEIILVNDGSTDESEQICRYYAEKDTRIKLVSNEKMGVSYSRNHGLDVSSGEFVVFVDSDDFISKYAIEIMVRISHKYDCEVVQSRCKWKCSLDDIDDFERASRFNIAIRRDKHDSAWALQGGSDGRLSGMVWAKLYRYRVWENTRFPVGKIHEDEAVMHKILYSADSTAILDSKLYYQVDSSDSIVRGTFSKQRYDLIEMLEDRYSFYVEKNFTDCAMVTAQRMAVALIDLYRDTERELGEKNKQLILKYQDILPSYINSPFLSPEKRDLHMKWAIDPWFGNSYYFIRYMGDNFGKKSDWQFSTCLEELENESY